MAVASTSRAAGAWAGTTWERIPPFASAWRRGNAFDRAIADFSVTCADQNERDFQAFTAAVKSGRPAAAPGP